MTDPASTDRAQSRRSPLPMIGLVALLLGAVLVAYWWTSRKRARELAADVHQQAVRLDECAPDRDALLLAFPEDRPAAGCAPIARALADAARRLRSAALLREPEMAADLAAVAEPLANASWNAPARSLLEPPLSVSLTEVSKAHSLAVVLAAAEDVAVAATPAAAAPLPRREPRVALELELPSAPLELAWSASSAIAPGGAPVATLSLAARTERGPVLLLARSFDLGKSWQTTKLDRVSSAQTLPRAHIALLAGGELAVAVFDATSARRFRWPAKSPRAEPLGEALTLPADHAPIATGSALLSPGAIALRRANGDGAVWYEPFDAKSLRAAPPGRLVAATASPPARLVLARASKTGFLELAQIAVPERKQPWPEAKTTRVSYTPALEMTPSPDLWCGLAGEQHFTWLARGNDNHVLLAASPSALYPFRFAIKDDSELSVLCGVCPPAALERGTRGLRVFLPVIRKLAPATIAAPLAFDATSAKTASAACTGEQLAAVYLAAERVLAQSTRSGNWRFQRPSMIAEPDANGAPVEAHALGFDDRIVVLWRRSVPGSKRVRIESVELPRE